jgi:hypothetical protein
MRGKNKLLCILILWCSCTVSFGHYLLCIDVCSQYYGRSSIIYIVCEVLISFMSTVQYTQIEETGVPCLQSLCVGSCTTMCGRAPCSKYECCV